jgi:hypothetical protein
MFKRMFVIVMTAAVIVVGCDESKAPAPAPQQAATALPAGLVLASAPAGEAKTVKEVRAVAKDGDDVVMRGIVAGRMEPIAANRAILTLLDPSIQTCDKMEDGCTTPWDACCAASDVIMDNSATVQVVDGQGAVLKSGLSSVPGLKPLKEVVVQGKLKVSPDGKAAVVNATGLYVMP